MARPTTRPVKAIDEGTFGWRLREALDQPDCGWSVNALAKHLKDRRTKGTINGQAIGEYLRNEKKPRRDVLLALAMALGVRAAWLAFDDGPMLDDNYSVRSTPLYLIKAARAESTYPTEMREEFLRGLGTDAKRDYLSLDPFERVAVGFLLARWIEKELRPAKRTAYARGELAGRILKHLSTMTRDLAGQKSAERAKARRGSRIWKTHFVQGIASLMLSGERDSAEAMKKR